MTLILFGIFFLVFYALGMGAYRRQQFIIVKCNNSKPASNVFYHQIIKRGGQISFIQYSDYLAEMAVHYPFLRFNVYFLIDDSYSTSQRAPKHNKLINRFIPYYPYGIYNYKMDEENTQAMLDFQNKYQNVNVTIMPLSKYMAMTPLKYKWKIVPSGIIPFYIRVFAVWENGGIGIDLVRFNNNFNTHQPTDRKITAVLKQHNDGINNEEYANTLNKIDKEQNGDLLSVFYGMLTNVLNQTRSFINKTLYLPTVTESNFYQPLVRTHRSKREVMTDPINEGNSSSENVNVNTTDSLTILQFNNELNNQTDTFNTMETLKPGDLKQDTNESSYGVSFKLTSNSNASEQRQVVLVYDLSIVSDIGPPYILSEPLISSLDFGPIFKPTKPVRHGGNLLALDTEGSFIAASAKLHPFLGYLISTEFQRPKYAIQDVFLTQCSGFLKNDAYCSNIYIL